MAHTPETRDKFIDALANVGQVGEACKLAGIDKKTAYNWRNSDKEFAAEWTEAIDRSTSILEDEAIRRAMDKMLKSKVFWLSLRA